MFERIDDLNNIPHMTETEFESILEEVTEYVEELEAEIDEDDESDIDIGSINRIKEAMNALDDEYRFDASSQDTKNAITNLIEALAGDND